MGKQFAMGWSPAKVTEAANRSDIAREAMIDGIVESDGGKRAGITREGIENAARFVRAQGNHQAPTLKAGVAGDALIRGERFQLTDEHTNAHGERVLEGYRQNGPHFERVRIVEGRHSEHTRVVSRVEGGR